jgi:DNA-binding CsgD family transcriptional regulator
MIGLPVEYGFMSTRVVSLLEEWAADYGNVRAALEWATASDPCVAMRLLAETQDLFFTLGQADGSQLAELILQRCLERNRDRAWVMAAAGQFAFLLGDVPAAVGLLTGAAEMSVELGEHRAEGTARLFLGIHQVFAGSPDKARATISSPPESFNSRQVISAARGEPQRHSDSATSWTVSWPVLARSWRPLAIDLAAQDRWSQGQANLYLGILAESSADPQAASSYFREAVECQRPYDDPTLLPVSLVGQASVLARRDPATALQLVAAAWAVRARNGGEFAPYFRAFAERTRAAAAPKVGSNADRLWQSGSRLTVDDAIALAFGTTPTGASTSSARRRRTRHALGISTREIDVVRLVAEGLSNKKIARRLHLSIRTVESHLRHVLTKTGLANRTQLATWVRERGE